MINEVLNFIMNQRNQNKGFEHFQEVMNALKNPQDQLNVIHVAGTNGKGSTIQFLSNILMAAGYKVGTFVSPHLITHQDRIQINHKNIEDDFIVSWFKKKKEWMINHELNMFEIDYCLMVDYFIHQKVDFALIETGLGGRLDPTNVIHHPLCSVITSIGFDHQDRLGNTMDEIAYEKAGIIKNECPVILGNFKNGKKVFYQMALEKNSKLIETPNIIKIKPHHFMIQGRTYVITSKANYQMNNAALAIKVIDYLKDEQGIVIKDDDINNGLMGPLWKGRFEPIGERIYLDGAHNVEGIKALIDSFESLEKPITVICSVLKDKDYHEMFDLLEKNSDYLYITTFDFYRAMNQEDLSRIKQGIKVENYQDLLKKLSKNETGTIVVCGSLYFISEVRAFFFL